MAMTEMNYPLSGGGVSNVEYGTMTLPINTTSSEVSLGYKPKWVALYYNNYPTAWLCGVQSGEQSAIKGGAEINNNARFTINITNNGFTVTTPYQSSASWNAVEAEWVAVKP